MALLANLFDRFDSLDLSKWTKEGYDQNLVTVTGGVFQIAHGATVNFTYNGVTSATTYDLTNSFAYVKVADFGNQSLASHEVQFWVWLDANNYVLFNASGNTLYTIKKVAGAQATINSVALNTTNHRWWKIRHDGTNIVFDVSPDGRIWTNRASLATPFAITAIKTRLLTGNWQTEASGSQAQFDEFSSDDVPIVVMSANAVVTASRSPALTFTGLTAKENNVVAFFAASGAAAAAASAPSAWVLPTPASGANPVASDSHTQCFVYHVITAAEESGGTITYTATNLWNAVQTGNVVGVVLRGVDATTVIDSLVSALDSGNTVTPHIFPALTGSNLSDNSLVVNAVAKDGTGTYTTPTGLTLRGLNNTNQAQSVFTRDAPTIVSTNVAAVNITPSAGDEYCAFSVAFLKTAVAAELTSTQTDTTEVKDTLSIIQDFVRTQTDTTEIKDTLTANIPAAAGSTPEFANVGARLVKATVVSTASIAIPADTDVGDGILVFLGIFPYSGASGTEITVTGVPSGFIAAPGSPATSDPDNATPPTPIRWHVYEHRPTGPEGPGTYDFTFSGNVYLRYGWASRYTGVITTGASFIDTADSDGINASGNAYPGVSLTTTGTNRLLVLASTALAGFSTTVASGFTKDAEGVTDDTDAAMCITSKEQAAAGSTGTLTPALSPSNAAAKALWLGALKPTEITGIDFTSTQTDITEVKDTFSTTQDLIRTQTDTTEAKDTLTKEIGKTQADTVEVKDILTTIQDLIRTQTDTSEVKDLLATIQDLVRTQTDTSELKDLLTKEIGKTQTDSTSVKDTLSAVQDLIRSQIDTSQLLDSLIKEIEKPQADVAGVKDIFSVVQDFVRSQLDTTEVKDIVSTTQDFVRIQADTVSVKDSIEFIITLVVNLFDSVDVNDSLIIQQDFVRSQTDTTEVKDLLGIQKDVVRSQTDSTQVKDSATFELVSGLIVNLFDTTEVKDLLGIQKDVVRLQTDSTEVKDSATFEIVAPSFISAVDQVNVTDSINFVIGFNREFNDLISVSDNLNVWNDFYRTAVDSVELTDTLSIVSDYVFEQVETISVTDSASFSLGEYGVFQYELVTIKDSAQFRLFGPFDPDRIANVKSSNRIAEVKPSHRIAEVKPSHRIADVQ